MSLGLLFTGEVPVEFEAGLFHQLDRDILAHIAKLHLRFLRDVGPAAVVDDAQYAARFERFVKGAQGAVDLVALDPIVQVAKSQDEIGAARRRDLMEIGVEFGDFHFGENRFIFFEPRQELLMILQIPRRGVLVAIGGDINAPAFR